MIYPINKRSLSVPGFLFLFSQCVGFLFIDLMLQPYVFLPYLSHGMLFYLVLYHTRLSWMTYALIAGLCFDLLNYLPLGTHFLTIFLLTSLATYTRLQLREGNFMPIWVSFGLIELAITLSTLLVTLLIFHQSLSFGFLIKHAVTWSFFPAQLYFLVRNTP